MRNSSIEDCKHYRVYIQLPLALVKYLTLLNSLQIAPLDKSLGRFFCFKMEIISQNDINMLNKVDPAANSTADPKASAPAENPVVRTETKPVDGAPYGVSDLQKMEWDNGRSIRYEPVSITFFTGDYAGQVLDLGFNVSELTENQTAVWGEIEARGIRGDKNISRSISSESVGTRL